MSLNIRSDAKYPIHVHRASYGWVLYDANDETAEHLTAGMRVKHYRSEEAAIRVCDKANRANVVIHEGNSHE